jgi:hypothetical protein
MKQYFKTMMAATVLGFISFSAFAQDEQPVTPKWVSDKGYWVVESNIKDPLNHVIRFYNNDNVLLYKEAVTGVKLNPEKRAVRMKLKKVLEASVIAWEQKKVTEENKNYVAAILK